MPSDASRVPGAALTASDFVTFRARLVADASVTGSAFTSAYRRLADSWLAELFNEATDDWRGLALVAVGGYGRGELCPSSDLDVVLVHDGRRDIGEVAERVWYPIWDVKVALGHAVRTVKEALSLARDDLDTATSLLDVRLIAGDATLAAGLQTGALAQWTRRADHWLRTLAEAVDERHRRAGEVAFLLEPDLKAGRGGLRDVQTLRWAETARPVLREGDVAALDAAYASLLSVRVELQRRTGRKGDVLLLQEQDGVAAALHERDADALMARVSAAGRTIAWTSDDTWAHLAQSTGRRRRSQTGAPRQVAPGVVAVDGEVVLAADADPATDPGLVLRLAAASLRDDARMERASLLRLEAGLPTYGDPWPAGAREDLVAVLQSGRRAIETLETLDRFDLLTRILPEWAAVRYRPQRNAYHRFTVDRHLVEAATNAAALCSRVERPDLLVLGALLHDIGKGHPGDHTDVGVELLGSIGPRMGYGPEDTAVLVAMCRHHLLLPEVATRRDLDDVETIRSVVSAVGAPSTLELLAALTEADSLATGPAAWSSWKAELVDELVHRALHVMGGGSLEDVARSEFPTPEQLAAVRAGETMVAGVGDTLTVVARDRPGLFSRVAGVLAVHGLDVLAAGALSTDDGMALEHFRVVGSSATIAREIDWPRVVTDVEKALAGRLAVEARVAARARSYRPRHRGPGMGPPVVRFEDRASSAATVIEVFAPDGVGALYRITRALAELELDIRLAKIETRGDAVVDAFYVLDSDGRLVSDPDHRREIERAILHALGES